MANKKGKLIDIFYCNVEKLEDRLFKLDQIVNWENFCPRLRNV
jgi:hypothetical protein